MYRKPWALIFSRQSPACLRPWIGLIFGIGAIFLVTCTDSHSRQDADSEHARHEPVNVVFIVVDTLRADHLGSYGYARPTSPHLDRLAEDSILFRQAHSHVPWTSPSVGSLLTARYPAVLGYGDSRQPARPDDDTLYIAEILKDNGYRTGAIVSHTYVAARLGFDQGFEHFDESNAKGPGHISSPSVTDKAIAFLERSDGRPFYLLGHYFDPHFNYLLHEEFNFDPDYDGEFPEKMGELRQGAKDLTSRDLEHLRARYDSEIRFTDQQIGRLLDALGSLRLYDDTLIVFTADHGESLRDREDNWIGHTKTLFQEAIHVPLLFKLPASRGAGTRVEASVGLIDVVPSIIDFLDLATPDGSLFDGEALPLDQPQALRSLAERAVFSETTARGGWLQSIVRGHWKLIFDRKNKQMSLFDLARDPGERSNLVEQNPPVLQQLATELRSWNRDIAGRRASGERKPTKFSPKEQEQLRALGYL